MPTPDSSPQNQIPLIVDLDGTLIKTDLLWESLAQLLRRNPFQIFPVLFWWMRGRAVLKRRLANRVKIDPAALPYNEKFIAWLREQKADGRKIILATASDQKLVLPVADHVKIFDEVLASDGKTNLRSKTKLKALTEKFGERNFDYAGNSSADFAVWRGSREAIVVNASQSVLKRAAQCTKLGPTFTETYFPFQITKRFLTELFIRSGYLIAILAGLLLAAAFPKFGIAGFAWIAPALILFAARGKNSGDSFRAGYVAGISFWLASLYWLLLIPVAGYPILGWIALSAFVALYFGTWTWLLAGKIGVGNWTQRNLWSLLGAAIWVALEMIRARFLGGFPWNLLGTSQFQLTPLIQIASVTGVYGVSFLVVWFSLCLLSATRMIFSKPNSRYAWQMEIFLPLLVIAGIFAFGFAKLREPIPATSTLRVTLIQPSVPQNMIWDSGANSNRFEELIKLSQIALTNETDLLVWPEAALPESPEVNFANRIAIANLVRAHHVWLICNADDYTPKINPIDDDKYDSFNSALLLNPSGEFVNVYHKRKLVIFGEFVPTFLKWFTPITGGYEAGNEPTQFEINRLDRVAPHRVNAAPLICFEDMFPQTARASVQSDTDFLVNLTNDGWFGKGAEQWQQMAAGIFRAVENGVPLVRCCNNGVTCWIDAHGRVRQIFKDDTGGIYGVGAMTFELPLPDEKPAPTFYNRQGDWFGWGCVIWTIAIVIRKFSRQKNLSGAKSNT